VAKVQWSDSWVAFGETLLQLVMLQSAEHYQSLHLPVALQKVIFDPLDHRSETQGLLSSLVGNVLDSVRETTFLCIGYVQVQSTFCCKSVPFLSSGSFGSCP
jgi:hypothetical protein